MSMSTQVVIDCGSCASRITFNCGPIINRELLNLYLTELGWIVRKDKSPICVECVEENHANQVA